MITWFSPYRVPSVTKPFYNIIFVSDQTDCGMKRFLIYLLPQRRFCRVLRATVILLNKIQFTSSKFTLRTFKLSLRCEYNYFLKELNTNLNLFITLRKQLSYEGVQICIGHFQYKTSAGDKSELKSSFKKPLVSVRN